MWLIPLVAFYFMSSLAIFSNTVDIAHCFLCLSSELLYSVNGRFFHCYCWVNMIQVFMKSRNQKQNSQISAYQNMQPSRLGRLSAALATITNSCDLLFAFLYTGEQILYFQSQSLLTREIIFDSCFPCKYIHSP